MADRAARRRFGNVRKLPSGWWQVRYRGPDARMRPAPQTFARKSEAERYLSLLEAQMASGEWTDTARGRVRLADYAERWIDQRPGLRPRTLALYRWLLGKHVTPYLGNVPLAKLDTQMIRQWRADLIDRGVSESMTAKAYRLLRAVLMTATREDRIIPRNPCRIPGADQEKAPERPVLSMAEVFRLADVVPDRYRAMILLAAFSSLRYGEVTALERRDIDTALCTVRVRQAYTEVTGRGLVVGPPKSRAGRRVVALPRAIVPDIGAHLSTYVGSAPGSLVFTGPAGAAIRRGNFNKLTKWKDAVRRIGRPGLHFHDLRHAGNTLAAASGASLRDLMVRMGHDSPAAALIYQHATSEADRAIADALDSRITGTPRQADERPDEGE